MTTDDHEPDSPTADDGAPLDPGLARLFRLAAADTGPVAARIDTDAVLTAVLAADDHPRHRPAPFRSALLPLGAGLALAVAVVAWFRLPGLLVLLFAVAPALLVVGWHRQARLPGTSGRSRVGRTVEDWAHQIDRQGRALAHRAAELHHRLDRLHRLEDMTSGERRRCADLGPADATPAVDDLRRGLARATAAATTLAERADAGAAQARRFARRCLLDPGAARAESGLLPWTVDPRQVAADVDDLLRELSVCADQAGDLTLLIAVIRAGPGPAAATRAAEIADGIGVGRRQVQVIRRPLLTECRELVVAFDILHALVTAREIGRITSGPGTTFAATAAVAASTLARPRVRRAAARTAFLQAARPATRSSWRWIGRATAAALSEGFGRGPGSDR